MAMLLLASCQMSQPGPAAPGANPTPAGEVPFKLSGPQNPLILIPVVIDGKGPYTFALDTGATLTIVSPELSQQLALTPFGSGEATGAGGKLQVTLARVHTFSVGAAAVDNLGVGIMNMDALEGALGSKLDGIVGYNFLRLFRVTIDYRASTLRFE
jgi:hypothetical protein